MSSIRRDEMREERIRNDIIVDAYTPEEQATSWYSYLSETLQFPFTARCIIHRPISPLIPGDELEIIDIAPEGECRHEIFVVIRWSPRLLAIPLSQIQGFQVPEQTQEAIDDWSYWVQRGYQF